CFDQNAQGATYVFSGEQYNWIVIYAPPGNNCAEKLNGGSSTQYIGTIYTPGADWTINGGNRSPLAGQVICYTAKVSGSAAVRIDCRTIRQPFGKLGPEIGGIHVPGYYSIKAGHGSDRTCFADPGGPREAQARPRSRAAAARRGG